MSLACPITLQQIKKKQKPLFHSVFWPFVPGKISPRERPTTQNDKNNKRSVLFFFPVLLLFVVVFPYLCVSRFACYSSFISLICFFSLICLFFTHLVLLFLPPFPSNCKAAEEGKKRQWMKKKTKRKQHEKQQTRRIGANRRWREINKHKPPPPHT